MSLLLRRFRPSSREISAEKLKSERSGWEEHDSDAQEKARGRKRGGVRRCSSRCEDFLFFVS